MDHEESTHFHLSLLRCCMVKWKTSSLGRFLLTHFFIPPHPVLSFILDAASKASVKQPWITDAPLRTPHLHKSPCCQVQHMILREAGASDSITSQTHSWPPGWPIKRNAESSSQITLFLLGTAKVAQRKSGLILRILMPTFAQSNLK